MGWRLCVPSPCHALADAVLLLDTADGLQVISDQRINQLAGKEREAANRVPTGSALKLRRRAQLTRAPRVLLSDGASRLVDPFGRATWEELLALLEESGPDELLRQVRAAEAVDPEGQQWPRTKRSDDATAVYLALNRGASH
jgi:hypothetical protein